MRYLQRMTKHTGSDVDGSAVVRSAIVGLAVVYCTGLWSCVL